MFQKKKKPELSGLDGFMSNFALLDCASVRIKDLIKEEFEIFPANLKQEASQFRNTMDTNLEQCFVEILSQTESIKRQFQRRQLAPEEAQLILQKVSLQNNTLFCVDLDPSIPMTKTSLLTSTNWNKDLKDSFKQLRDSCMRLQM